jgi:amino acid permease
VWFLDCFSYCIARLCPRSIVSSSALQLILALHNRLHIQVIVALFYFKTFLTHFTSAFEGIGTIVAIESSMRSPRRKFPQLLAISIASVLVILCCFGTACYGYFGSEVSQAITLNLSNGSHLVLALLSFILVSILLTFPLQVFPIFLAVEDVWLIQRRSLFLTRRALIIACCSGKAENPLVLLISAILLIFFLGVAYLAQNYFAYVGAINGAIGCAILLFVLPCVIDLKLNAHPVVILLESFFMFIKYACC